MSYVVYHVKSTMEKRRYNQARHAKALAEKLGPAYAWASSSYYKAKVVHTVLRKNLMTGKYYEEPSNTPNYMSPASEAYWSM